MINIKKSFHNYMTRVNLVGFAFIDWNTSSESIVEGVFYLVDCNPIVLEVTIGLLYNDLECLHRLHKKIFFVASVRFIAKFNSYQTRLHVDLYGF